MATYDKMTSPAGRKVQVESAIRDGSGKNIENNYVKHDSYDETLGVGYADRAQNLQSTRFHNSKWGEHVCRTVCAEDSCIDGKAYLTKIEGRKTVSGNEIHKAKISSINETGYNLLDSSLDGKHIRIPDNLADLSTDQRAIQIIGAGSADASVYVVNTSTGTGTTTARSISNGTWTAPNGVVTNYRYFTLTVEDAGKFVYIPNADSTTMVLMVWSKYNTNISYHEPLDPNPSITFSNGIFTNGLDNIVVNGVSVVQDTIEIIGGTTAKKYQRVNEYALNAGSFTNQTKSGNFYRYQISASGSKNLGYLELDGEEGIITTLPLNQTSTISAECVQLASSYIYAYLTGQHAFATGGSATAGDPVDTSKEYYYLDSTTSDYVSLGTFETQEEFDAAIEQYTTLYYDLTDAGASYLYTTLGIRYVFVERATASVGSDVSGTYSIDICDFGLEWTTGCDVLALPILHIDYPLDTKATVENLPTTYISNDRFDYLCKKVQDVAGLQITRDPSKVGTDQEFSVVDTKETIVRLNTELNPYSLPFTITNQEDLKTLTSVAKKTDIQSCVYFLLKARGFGGKTSQELMIGKIGTPTHNVIIIGWSYWRTILYFQSNDGITWTVNKLI